MTPPTRSSLARWLDVRPEEVRTVALSFGGAFLTLSFLVMARALREALYLSAFAVETLPYITGAVAVLSVPAVGVFARSLSHGHPQTVLSRVVIGLGIALAALAPFVGGSRAAVVGFYLATAVGTLLLTSGFWLVTAELFPVRGAKRLFGLIGAGGTVGAMVTGNTLALVTSRLPLSALVPGLIAILALFLAVQVGLPRLDSHIDSRAPGAPETGGRGGDRGGRESGAESSMRDSLASVWRTPHLRAVALIVAAATVASTLVDYQFKELARAALDSGEALAGFFGAFYGWAGAVALLVQVAATARVMSSAGLAVALGILPGLLLLGSVGLLLIPGLITATVVRGADNALRKSLHRSALEVLFVPLPADLRRRTKTFIDSVADSAAEGMGAAIVFAVVTFGGLPSSRLSYGVAALALLFLWLARRAGTSYATTVASQLRAGVRASVFADQRDLMSATFTNLDLSSALEESDVSVSTPDVGNRRTPGRRPAPATVGHRVDLPVAGLADAPSPPSRESPEVAALLARTGAWGAERVEGLARLLARDDLYREVSEVLARHEEHALDHLARVLTDPEASFVIRRRIPAILGRYADARADTALLEAITAPRFEVRYRSALALVRRRRAGRLVDPLAAGHVWVAVRAEVSRERPVWELQRLLDDDRAGDEFVAGHIEARGHLSLEHTFRLLSLVLDPEAVSSAYHALSGGEDRLRSLALEYLHQALPDDIRRRMWPFIGDLSDHQERARRRPLGDVVSDLVSGSATVFVTEEDRRKLRDLLDDR